MRRSCGMSIGNSNDLFTARVAPCGPLPLSRGARARVRLPASCCPPGGRPALEHRGRPAPWRPSPVTPVRQRLAQPCRQPAGRRPARRGVHRAMQKSQCAPWQGGQHPGHLAHRGPHPVVPRLGCCHRLIAHMVRPGVCSLLLPTPRSARYWPSIKCESRVYAVPGSSMSPYAILATTVTLLRH